MKIVTVSFNYPEEMKRPDYELLARVFEYSCKKYAPYAEFVNIKVDAPMLPDNDTHALNFLYNTIKLEKWVEVLENSKENIIFADCDMILIRDLVEDDIFGKDFDVGYTERTEKRTRFDSVTRQYWGSEKIRRMPMNGGVMFAKPTEAARDWYKQYVAANQYLYDNPIIHKKWNVKYAGMNQAAFGYFFEEGDYKAKVKSFPCKIWNAVDSDWARVGILDTKFVHIKSKLRRLVLKREMPYGNFKPAMCRWYELAGEIGVPVWHRE